MVKDKYLFTTKDKKKSAKKCTGSCNLLAMQITNISSYNNLPDIIKNHLWNTQIDKAFKKKQLLLSNIIPSNQYLIVRLINGA